jgi:ubiquinone/menaquinone biosynthesis C-methylase UbiE
LNCVDSSLEAARPEVRDPPSDMNSIMWDQSRDYETMDIDEFARVLTSDERREWQDPVKISKAIGIESGMTVADLACGPGFFTLPLALLVGKRGQVYAVDSNPRMLHHLRTNIKKSGAYTENIKVIQADVSKTGIPSGSVDVAIFANVLHDIADVRAFLDEVKRISGSKATVVDIDWKKARMEFGPPFEIRLSETEARRILSKNGLAVSRIIEAGPYHYGLVSSHTR